MGLLNKDVLALDWDHRQVRAVVARVVKGEVTVRRMFQEAVPEDVAPENAPAFGAWLGKTLGKHHCRGLRVIVAIPREQAVLKDLSLPANTPEIEIASLVQFQMQKELPFAADEAVIDYAARGTAPASRGPVAAGEDTAQPAKAPAPIAAVDYLVAATRREGIIHVQQVANAAGIELARIRLRCFCNLATVKACAPADAARQLLLVNVGPELTEIDIVRDNGLLFSRSASVPLSEQEETSEFLNRLTLEVIRSAQAARATVTDLELDGVAVAAPEWIAPAIAERLGPRLDVRSWMLEPGRSIKLPEAARRGHGEFSAAIGMVLGEVGVDAGLDFLHPHRPVDLLALRKAKRTRWVAIGVGVAAALVVANAIALKVVAYQNDQADAAINKVMESRARQLSETASWFGRQEKADPVWLGQFARLDDLWEQRWRKDAYIVEFSGSVGRDGWTITVTGWARGQDVVDDLVQQVQKLYPKQSVNAERPTELGATASFNSKFVLSIRPPAPAGKRVR